MKKYELMPDDGRKSFYGKASVSELDGVLTLTSYTTAVCEYDRSTGTFTRLWGGYSATTQRHVNAFRERLGLTTISKSEWLSLLCRD